MEGPGGNSAMNSGRQYNAHQTIQMVLKLQHAVHEGKLDQMKKLLQSNTECDFSVRGNNGKTVLYYAVMKNNVEIVKTLLEHGLDPLVNNFVAYHDQHHLVSREEPLIVTAARTGVRLEIVRLLLKYKVNPDAQSVRTDRSGEAPVLDKCAMHFACEQVNHDLVELLLDHCASVDLPDRSGEFPLHKLARCKDCDKQTRIMRLLCQQRSPGVNHMSKCECSPLYIATFYGCARKIETLLQDGANINNRSAKENSYGSPLHLAAAKDHVEITKLLLKYKAKLSILNSSDCTPLHLNINSQLRSSVAIILLQHGSVTSGRDKWNYSLLAACINNMRIDCETLAHTLVAAGYDLSQDVWLDPQFSQKQGEFVDIEVPEVKIPPGRMRSLCDWLYVQQSSVPKLSQQCRNTIRRRLHDITQDCSIMDNVLALPLPQTLKNYLLLKDTIPSDVLN